MTRQKYTTKNKHLSTNLRQKHANACFHTPLNIRKNHILRLHPQCMKLHSKCGYYSVGAHNFVLLFNHYHTTRKNLRNQQLQHISPLVCLLSWTNPLWCKTIRRNKDKWYIFSSDGHPMHIPWPSATHQPPSVPRMIDNRKTSVVTFNPTAGIKHTNIYFINLPNIDSMSTIWLLSTPSIHPSTHAVRHFAHYSPAHSNSILTFPNNIYRNTC